MLRGFVCGVSFAVLTHAYAGVNEWTPAGPDGGTVRAIAYHPTTPGLVLAVAGSSIYRSEDSGLSWTAVLEKVPISRTRIVIDPLDPDRVMTGGFNAIYISEDAGKTFGLAATPGNIDELVMAGDGSAVYAVEGSPNPRVFRSTDFGESWAPSSAGLPADDMIRDFTIDPQNPDALYLITDTYGIYQSTNAGGSWTLISSMPGLSTSKIAIDPADSNRLLIASAALGLFESTDGGATWPSNWPGQYAWVGFPPGATNGEAVAVQYFGPTVRRNGSADPWVDGQSLRLQNIDDGSFDPSDTDPTSSTLMLATAEGPLLTEDGGASFEARGDGIRAARVKRIVAANDADGTMYAAFSEGPIGVYRRTPSGWLAVDNAELRTTVPAEFDPEALAVDPADPDADTLLVTTGSSLVKSSDGGLSWSLPHPTFAAGFLLTRDLQYAPSDAQVIYASTDNDGVYKSVNGGTTWVPVPAGLPPSVGALAVDPTTADTAYAAAFYPPSPPVLYKTTDGGASWSPADSGLAAESVQTVAVDADDPDIVYAGGGEGLFKSLDAGASWSRVGAPISDAPSVSIAIDPVVPTTLVMTLNGTATGAARSVDGGATWEDLTFTRFGSLLDRIALDPLKPYNVLASASNYGLVEFEVSPDLELSLPSLADTLPLDGSVSQTVRVENAGPYAASAVVLTIALPAGTTASSPSATQGSCSPGVASIDCALGAVPVGQQVDVAFTMTAGSSASSDALVASVAAHESDPDSADNTESVTITTRRISDLGVSLAPDSARVARGDAVTLTAVVSNDGPNDSTATEVVIDLGTGLAFDGAAASQGSCSESNGAVTCAIDALTASGQATITIDATTAVAGSLSPTARVADPTVLDTAAANDTAMAPIVSLPVSDASIDISDSADPVVSGRQIQYTATVTNAGPDDLTAVTVTVNLSGATAASASSSAQSVCSALGSRATCSLNGLASGDSATVTVAATAGGAGTATAEASVAFDGTDTASDNDTASQSTTVNAASSGGSGGGSSGWLELLLLALLTGYRPARRHLRL